MRWQLPLILLRKFSKLRQFLPIMMREIGRIIGEAMERVGKDGIISCS